MNINKKILTGIAAVLGTILLGAIGSGLWERCLSHLLDWIVKLVVSGMSLASNTYKNGIYEEAAKGFHEYSSLFLHTLVLTMVPMFYCYVLIRHPHVKKDGVDNKTRTFLRSRIGYYTLTILTFAVMIVFSLYLTKTTYINTIVTITRQSISILAPLIQESDEKELWAMYYSMTTEKDFQEFKSRLENLAKEKSVILPQYPGLWTR